MVEQNDWRLTNQRNYLQGAVLVWKVWTQRREDWDHDHCEFCWAKFMENRADAEGAGYTTEDEYRWICKRCFQDFHEMFQWIVKSNQE